MSAWCFRSSMKRWGNNGISPSILQFHDRGAAAAFVLRRELGAGDERMVLEKCGDGAPELPGAVAVDDTDRMLIRPRRFIQKFLETRDGLIDRLTNDVQFRERAFARLQIDVHPDRR